MVVNNLASGDGITPPRPLFVVRYNGPRRFLVIGYTTGRAFFVGALLGPPPPIPRISPGSAPQFLGSIQPAPLVVHGITFPGIPCRFGGFSFHRIPRQGSPPRFTDTRRGRSCACLPLFVWVVHFVRLGCSPARTQRRPASVQPHPGTIPPAVPFANPVPGPLVYGRSCESRPARRGWVVGAPFGRLAAGVTDSPPTLGK